MESAAKLLSATCAGAGNLAFLFAFALGGACAENLALPKAAAVLDSWSGSLVACSLLVLGCCLHVAGYVLGASHAVASPSPSRRGRELSPSTR